MSYPRDKFPFRELSLDDRALLAHEIWTSIEEECAKMEMTDEFRAELNRRIESHKRNPQNAITWEELKTQLRTLLKSNAGNYLSSKGGSNRDFKAGRRRRSQPEAQ